MYFWSLYKRAWTSFSTLPTSPRPIRAAYIATGDLTGIKEPLPASSLSFG